VSSGLILVVVMPSRITADEAAASRPILGGRSAHIAPVEAKHPGLGGQRGEFDLLRGVQQGPWPHACF
jgi:hypothetical protein